MPTSSLETSIEPARAPAVELTAELIRTHQRHLWRFARYLGAPPAEAEDLVQETFLRVLTARPAHLGDREFAAWLRRTTLNLFRNSGRRPRHGVVLDETVLRDFWQREVTDDSDAYLTALDSCLAQLDDRSRIAVTLRYCEDRPRAQVAARLNVTLEGCRSILRRARQRLRACVRSRMRSEP